MISQALQLSQLSHLSQLSTMVLELELDMMETDLSVAFDPYDDDGVYELLVNTSHVDLRGSVALGQLGQVGPVNGHLKSSRAVRKRPSYRRNLSLDVLIISSLTSNTVAKGGTGTCGTTNAGSSGASGGLTAPVAASKKSILTRVSSTSSDESLFDLERPASPDSSRMRPQAIRPFKMDLESIPRLHSPPVPAKFSALQRGQPKFTTMAVIHDESKTPPTVRQGKLAHTSGNKIFQQGNVIEEGNEDDEDDETKPPAYNRLSPIPVQRKKSTLGQGNGHAIGHSHLPVLPAELPGRGIPRDLRVP